METTETIVNAPRIRFIYNKHPTYGRYFINGAIGGSTPRGEIICNFFFEYRDVASSEEAIIEEGQIKTLDKPVSEIEISREIQCGIVLKTDEARRIAEWLRTKADECDLQFKKE